jgi:parvulin-like peptidyl-prolyl isomerase
MGKGERDPNKQKDQPQGKRAERRAAKRRSAEAEAAREQRQDESEQTNRRLIVGSVIAVLIVAIGFIAFGWYQTQIRPLGKTVLRVEETKYSLAHLERRMELELDTGFTFSRTSGTIINLPDFMIDQLEGEAALIEGLSELQLELTDEDVAAEIRRRGGLADDVEPAVFADEVRRQVDNSGLKQNEYDLMIRGFLAEEQARNVFVLANPSEELQVRGQWIIVDDEDIADETVLRLEAGEDFLVVAEEVTVNPSNVELDWFTRGEVPTVFGEVEDFFFDEESTGRSEIIAIGDFLYIVEVLERDEARDLDDDQRDIVADRELRAWIDGLRDTLDIERNLSQDDAVRAVNDLF